MRAAIAVPFAAFLAVGCTNGVEPLGDDIVGPSPNDPNDPNGPNEPNDPNDPDDPNGPDAPSDPDDPSDPHDPVDPVIPGACMADAALLESLAAEFEAALDAESVPGGVFGVAIGDCIFTHGVGVDREGAPIDGRTRFQMASVSKFFAAVTASSLAEDGFLDLYAPASSIVTGLNDIAPYDVSFTLDDLLAHRAGFSGWYVDDDGSVLDRGPFFAAHAAEPLWAKPGEVYTYNNQGYALAGHVIESAAGAPYAALVQSRVFDAVGMTDSRIGSTMSPTEPRSAVGHSGTPQSFALYGTDDAFFQSEMYEPMGGVWSTARDLALLGKAFITADPRLLPQARVLDIATSRGPSGGTGGAYGYGLEIYGDLWTHSGATSGFLTELSMVPSRGVVFAAMVDADWHYPYQFASAAINALAPGLDYGPFPDDTDASEWVGRYVDPVIAGTIEVTAQGNSLAVEFVDVGDSVVVELAWDATYFGPLFDWGEMEYVMQIGSDGTRYMATRGFIAHKL